MRWVHRSLAVLTLGPIVIWILCYVFLAVLPSIHGCPAEAGNPYTCDMTDLDVSGWVPILGIFALWVVLSAWPLPVAFGLVWGLIAILQRLWRLLISCRPPPLS